MPRYWVIAPVESKPPELFDKVWKFDLANNLNCSNDEKATALQNRHGPPHEDEPGRARPPARSRERIGYAADVGTGRPSAGQTAADRIRGVVRRHFRQRLH